VFHLCAISHDSRVQLPHLRPFAKNPLYFLTACTDDRQPLLANEVSFGEVVAAWRKSAKFDGWFVGRFVLMPDHVHFFARPALDAKTCAEWMKAWKSISSRAIGTKLRINPPVWQRDYFDHFMRSAQSYAEKWEYVRQNPVRKGLVAKPEGWPWQGVIHDLTF
jgi:putative transposase